MRAKIINKSKSVVKKIFRKKPARNNLTVLSDDIFLVSYPRSGNTWIRFLLGSIIYGSNVNWDTMEKYVPDIYRNSDKQLLWNSARPRVLKSHHSYDERYPKVIYIIRDVRNVFSSYYNYHLKMKGYTGSREQFYKEFISGSLDDFGDWGLNVNSWVENQRNLDKGFYLLKYEELRTNTFGEIEKVLKFLSIKRSNKEINESIQWASLGNMKKQEELFKDKVQLLNDSNKDISFVGKGNIYPDINDNQNILDKLEAHYSKTLKEHGYLRNITE
jgi:hypothetical protein